MNYQKLYKEYQDNYNYLFFKNFNDAESFYNYLVNSKLIVISIKLISEKSKIEGWGYSVLDTSIRRDNYGSKN